MAVNNPDKKFYNIGPWNKARDFSVRWLSVDGHSVDGHYVVCHLGRITIRNDSYVAWLLGRIGLWKPYTNVT